MPPTIMNRGLIVPLTRTRRSVARLSASVPSRHTQFSVVFTTNIKESNFRYTQLTAPSSAGPGTLQRHESLTRSNAIGEHSSSTERWNDVPRGTMDEVSSFGRLDPPFV